MAVALQEKIRDVNIDKNNILGRKILHNFFTVEFMF